MPCFYKTNISKRFKNETKLLWLSEYSTPRYVAINKAIGATKEKVIPNEQPKAANHLLKKSSSLFSASSATLCQYCLGISVIKLKAAIVKCSKVGNKVDNKVAYSHQ